MPQRRCALCADKGVSVESLSPNKHLAGALLGVSHPTGPKLCRKESAVWVSVGFAGGFGVGSSLAVVV